MDLGDALRPLSLLRQRPPPLDRAPRQVLRKSMLGAQRQLRFGPLLAHDCLSTQLVEDR